MKRAIPITTLFLDIGGVLLTNGWDHQVRKRAAKQFALDLDEMEDRHHLAFDTYEVGKLTLDEYLSRVVFYQKRPFTQGQFRKFMFGQSKPLPKMIELMRKLKARHGLKIAVVSNEGRELTVHRIKSSSWMASWTFSSPPASSTFVSLMRTCIGWHWTSPRCRPGR